MHHTSKKESKKEKEKNKVTKNLRESGPSEYVELKMHASIHWTTSVNAE